MDREAVILAAFAIGSFISGIATVRFLLGKSTLARNAYNAYSLKVPLLGKISFDTFSGSKGIVIDEVLAVRENFDRLKQFLDPDLLLKYAKEFRINYVGVEGDKEDGSWSQGRLAFCEMNGSSKDGHNIYLNPHLDIKALSSYLSWELETTIQPSEVYPFLFLHEVGHTTKAGNQNFYTAVVNHALSGERWSIKRRKELSRIKGSIEDYADRFALKELSRWRDEKQKSLP